MNKFATYFLGFFFIMFAFFIFGVCAFRIHDFQGRCSLCHVNAQGSSGAPSDLSFTDEIDKLCAKCHDIANQRSHPIKVKPQKNIPLSAHLDKNGLMSCSTCHDVHKEDKTSNKFELSGLLWGHIKGRAFCDLCHNKESIGSSWRHQTAIVYAHSQGKLIQNAKGAFLDKFSSECLSCHDGSISKFPRVEVKQGVWQHGIGISHPVGVEYPRGEDFKFADSLPKEVRLFDGKIGCLSCHEIYNSKVKNMLAMSNAKSRLCLACHKK